MRNGIRCKNGVHGVKLSRGENAAVTASTVAVTLTWESQYDVDPQALLLAENGKIRTNDDFVFYNATQHCCSGVGRSVADREATGSRSWTT
ncbi:TerD family protein [Nocardia sp. FBN12]|uniref:TerD family protein n=1 Tax=Nocardia sp. FBN12 TaxID=3419766 RepID=UPI003D00D704